MDHPASGRELIRLTHSVANLANRYNHYLDYIFPGNMQLGPLYREEGDEASVPVIQLVSCATEMLLASLTVFACALHQYTQSILARIDLVRARDHLLLHIHRDRRLSTVQAEALMGNLDRGICGGLDTLTQDCWQLFLLVPQGAGRGRPLGLPRLLKSFIALPTITDDMRTRAVQLEGKWSTATGIPA